MNKQRILCFFVFCLVVGLLCGCGDIEISGIENFSENSCDKGLNDDLLPGDRAFLSSYTYLEAEYRYWTDGAYQQYKTFVRLQYTEAVYENAKAACQMVYDFSYATLSYGDYHFSAPRYLFNGEDGLQMCGFHDETQTVIFLGSYGFDLDQNEIVTEESLADFLKHM